MRYSACAFLLLANESYAEIDIRGTFDTQASYVIHYLDSYSNRLQSFDNRLGVEVERNFDNGFRFYSETVLRYESTDNLEPYRPRQDSSGKLNRRWLIDNKTELELREFYVDGYIEDVFIRLGKQQVVWGQADGLQVLDVVNPMRYREFISDDLENRRIPLWTANAEFPVRDWTMQFLWIPDQSYHAYPEAGGSYEVHSSKLTPMHTGTQQVLLERQEKPDRFWQDSDYGMRLTGFVRGWDVGFSYLNQINNGRAVAQFIDNDILHIRTGYLRTHLLGATFAKAFGSVTVRSELGYLSDSVPLGVPSTSAVTLEQSATREIKSVIGLDYNGISDTLLSAQWFLSRIADENHAYVRDKQEQQVSFLVKRDFYNQTFSLEGLLVHSLNDDDGYWHLSANYKYRSNLTLSSGIDRYYGAKDRVFGQFRDQSRVSIGLSYAF